jgi:ferredoxin
MCTGCGGNGHCSTCGGDGIDPLAPPMPDYDPTGESYDQDFP